MAKGKESRSLLDAIKNDINHSSGGNFQNLFNLRESGSKCRVRFLDDFEEATVVVFHEKWGEINHPCLEQYGKDCPNCDNSEVKSPQRYVWNIYNYETKKEELFSYKANKSSPISALVAIYEMLGTLTNQDLIIQRNGSGMSTTYTVVPTGKVMEFSKRVKPMSAKKILKWCFETYKEYGEDYESDDYEEDEEDTKPVNKKSSSKKQQKRYEEPDDDDYDEDDEDEEDDTPDYDEMSLKELRILCKSRKIKVKKSDDEEDLIEKLEEYDEENDDEEPPFDDEEDEDEDDLPPPRKKNKKKK